MSGLVVHPCAHCGARNRFPKDKAAQARCGRCGKMVLPDAPVVADERSFAELAEGSPVPVLVDFWAPWCGPCRMIAPVLDEIAHELAGRLKVVKVNVDENPNLAARFGVRSIPTLVVLVDGAEADRLMGAMPKGALLARLSRHL